MDFKFSELTIVENLKHEDVELFQRKINVQDIEDYLFKNFNNGYCRTYFVNKELQIEYLYNDIVMEESFSINQLKNLKESIFSKFFHLNENKYKIEYELGLIKEDYKFFYIFFDMNGFIKALANYIYYYNDKENIIFKKRFPFIRYCLNKNNFCF